MPDLRFRQERLAVIEEVCDRYGADGIEIDHSGKVMSAGQISGAFRYGHPPIQLPATLEWKRAPWYIAEPATVVEFPVGCPPLRQGKNELIVALIRENTGKTQPVVVRDVELDVRFGEGLGKVWGRFGEGLKN